MNNASDTRRASPAGVDRQTFLARVHQALGRDETLAPGDEPPAVDESLVRLCSEQDDVLGRFESKAIEVGMRVERCTINDLAARITTRINENDTKRIALSLADPSLREMTENALREIDCEICDWKDASSVDPHFDTDIGITDVDCAIADTGSIVYSSSDERSRGTYLIPPRHIAIVRASLILPDLIDYFSPDERSRGSGAARVLITGPSKTADIEGVLITGVHGPGEVHILIVTDG